MTYPAEEFWEALVNDGLDDTTIYISEPDRHHGADDEQHGQEVD